MCEMLLHLHARQSTTKLIKPSRHLFEKQLNGELQMHLGRSVLPYNATSAKPYHVLVVSHVYRPITEHGLDLVYFDP